MNKNYKIQILVLIFTFVIIILIPTDVVWGGQNFQTVPSVPPTATATSTPTETPTDVPTETPTATLFFTSTQPANTLTATQKPSSTFTITVSVLSPTPTQVVISQPPSAPLAIVLLIGLGIIVFAGVILIFILRKRKFI
jgi:hypothetical protein